MKPCISIVLLAVVMLLPRMASAHVSEQGLALLLPTGAYIIAGVSAVGLTVMALFTVTGDGVRRLFAHRRLVARDFAKLQRVTSSASTLLLALILYIGFTGTRDPLSNLMPLSFWTVGWVALVSLTALFGNLWHWLNPWTGLYSLLPALQPRLSLPKFLGVWPACLLLIGFGGFLLADIAPDDPARLARFVAFYWGLTFAGLVLCGPSWMAQVEMGHVLFTSLSRLGAVRLRVPAGIGGPGWQVIARPAPRAAGVFALILLAVGSFDGINETFWWLAQIGINPLEFPGRSAVVLPTLLGLGGTIVALAALFGAVVWLGLKIARVDTPFTTTFGRLALCVLPIALVYHMAHYLTSFIVLIQYTVAAISDPFATGADLLGIQPFRVTTGFFNSIDTVRLIWFTQAGLIVLGHVWSVFLSHRMALDLFGNSRRAAFATLPLSLFMIGYTFLGLWLLAAPKGL